MKNLVHAFKIETKIMIFGCASVHVLLNQMPKAIFKMIPVPSLLMHDSNQNCLVPILDRNRVSKSRPSENSLADFCTSALLLKALNLYSKKANFQAFSSAEVYKSAREFSHGLDFRLKLQIKLFT